MAYYLYRFLDEANNIIYVGRTDKPLIDRINSHTHLSKECYEDRKKIEYTTCKDKPSLVIYELYYINKWKPKYNTVQKYSNNMSLHLPELKWAQYNPKDFVKKELKKQKQYGIDFKPKKQVYNKEVWDRFQIFFDQYPKKSIEEFIDLENSREINTIPNSICKDKYLEFNEEEYEKYENDINTLTICFGITYSLKRVCGGRNAEISCEYIHTPKGTICKICYNKEDKLGYWYWWIFKNFYELK